MHSSLSVKPLIVAALVADCYTKQMRSLVGFFPFAKREGFQLFLVVLLVVLLPDI